MTHKNYLILVKHSLPEIVENVPAREWKLSAEGQERAKELAGKLLRYQPEILVSSTEPKAQQTAEIIGAALGVKYLALEGLHEHDRSQSPFYAKGDFQLLVQEFFEKPNALVFGNETAQQALARFRDVIDSILRSYNAKNVAVISHGTVISLFVSWLTGCNGFLLWKELGLPSFVLLDMQSKLLLKTENITQGG
jgi:broad specificity phosphatase PhoE